MTRPALAVVMPAYDEAANLRELLPELNAVLGAMADVDSSVHVVLRMGAPDSELDDVRALGAVPHRREPSDSFGDAIRTGIRVVPVEADYVVFMDADGSHSPTAIPRLLEFAATNDVVVASRYVSGGQSDNGVVLRAMSRSLNICFRLVLGIPCSDVSTNFKVYHRDQLQAITVTCDKFDVVEEILFRLQRLVGRNRFRVHEVPDYFRERRYGESKRRLGPFVASYVVTLVRLRLTTGN